MEITHIKPKSENGFPVGRSGFTLIEILVSVGILAIAATLIVQVLFASVHADKKTEVLRDIKQNGNFTLQVIGRMVRSAKDITTSCSGGATFATSAQITNQDNSVTTVTCTLVDGVARIAAVTGSQTAYLSAGNVTLSTAGTCPGSLAFSCPPSSGIQDELTVSFTLGQVGAGGTQYESGDTFFQNTIRLRN